MKKMRLLACVLTLSVALPGAERLLARETLKGSEAELDRKVSELVKKMTLEEKVGQMTQVTVDVISKQIQKGQGHELDQQKMEEALLKYHVGSVLNIGADAAYYDAAFTIDHWWEVITRIQDMALQKSRLKIPVLYGIDSIHGGTYVVGATLFPQQIALAATWNTELARKQGEITALETRVTGIPWNFSPVLDIARQPLWPRVWETFGEDTYLATAMGVAMIDGMQGTDFSAPDRVASCMKHYTGYGYPTSGKDRTPALIPERALRDIYLPPFEAAIKAGSPTIMINSGEIDGMPTHANHYLLTQVLRKEMGFKGLAVSDWEDIIRLHERDKVAATPQQAVEMAVNAGIDMSMVPYNLSFPQLLTKAVREGKVPMKRIDEAVSRILRVKFQLGLFENAYPPKEMRSRFATAESAEANRAAAREAMTLLKNENGTLPLGKNLKVLVTGPTANSLSMLNGGWTISWQGDREELYPKDKPTILQAIRQKIGEGNVTYVPGSTTDKEIDIDAAVKAAKSADVAVVCLGEKPYTETLGNIDDLTLEAPQLKLVDALQRTGKPVVIVLVEGRPRVFTTAAEKAQAILHAYLPGMEGGTAVADVLFGDFNPSGKLPYSYPRSTGSIVPYDHKHMEAWGGNVYNPLYPFGHGLSYTSFGYSDLKLSLHEIIPGQSVKAFVTITNTGKRAGKEVVQLYINDEYGQVSRPVKQLKGFQKIALEPGEKKTVEFTIRPEDMMFTGLDYKRIIEPGEIKVMVGPLKTGFWIKDPKKK